MNKRGILAFGVLGLVATAWGCSSSEGDDNTIESGGGGTGGSVLPPMGGSSAATTGGVSGSGGTAGTGGTGTGGYSGSLLECTTYDNLGPCGSTAVTARVQPVDILLILDKSGSMSLQPQGYPDRKWPALRTALGLALNQLKPYSWFGLELFPRRDVTQACDSQTDACCQMATAVDVEVGDGNTTVPLIIDAMAEPTGPGGRTPTAAALALALDYYSNRPIGPEGSVHNAYVFLATDGGPNCSTSVTNCAPAQCTTNLDGTFASPPINCGPTGPSNCCDPVNGIANSSVRDCLDDADSVAAVEALLAIGIKTVVIGIPGSEPYADVLNRLALAGGAANTNGATSYYQVEAGHPEQLTQVFIDITMDLIRTCDIWLEDSPPGPDMINIALDCQALPRTDAVTGATNWEIDGSTEPPTLHLVGDACTEAMSTGVRRVDVLFGCPPLN
jgi:hypothetical protein